jgi:hypothetical protein
MAFSPGSHLAGMGGARLAVRPANCRLSWLTSTRADRADSDPGDRRRSGSRG